MVAALQTDVVGDVSDVAPIEVEASTLVAAALTLVVAYVVVRAATFLLTEASERTVEHRITVKMFVPLTKFFVYGAAIYLVLGPVLQLTSGQILAFAGLLGAALGIGIKDLFANVVGGVVIVFEQPYRIGDKVEIGDHYGEVVDIGIRSTELVTNQDDRVSVPNYMLFTESISNSNAGATELMAVTDVYVSDHADVEEAMEVMRDALVTSRYVYLSPDHETSVRAIEHPEYTTVRGKAYVNDVRREFDFVGDVTRRVIWEFEEREIETPDLALGPEARGNRV